MRRVLLAAGVAAATLLAAGCSSAATGASGSGSGPVVLRLGFLANITHEPALVMPFFTTREAPPEAAPEMILMAVPVDGCHALIAGLGPT